MSAAILDALQGATIVGSGLIGGVFFAFSSFIMRALAQAPPAEGIRAMQRINVTVLNPAFLGVFFGTAATGLALMVLGLAGATEVRAGLRAAGGGLYLLGTFGVTVAFNVPRNEALAQLDARDPRSADAWTAYLKTWTFWNHVRTAAALGAMASLLAAGTS